MKECPYCHLENPDQAKYCLACGRKLTDEKPRLLRVLKHKIRPEENFEDKQSDDPQTKTEKQPDPNAEGEVIGQDSALPKEEPASGLSDDFSSQPEKASDPEAEFFEKELGKEKESKNLLGRLFAGDHVEEQTEYQPLSSRFQPDISSVDLETEERRRREQQERKEKQEQEARRSRISLAQQQQDKQKLMLTTVICLLSCLVVVLGLIVMTQSARNASSRPHTSTGTSSMKRYFDDSYTDDWKESRSEATTFEEIDDDSGWDTDDDEGLEDSGEFIEELISDNDPELGSGYGDMYLTQFVMKVRSQPTLDAGTVGSLSAGEKVEIDETRTDDSGATWGHLADQSGWVCIRDSQQTYLVAED